MKKTVLTLALLASFFLAPQIFAAPPQASTIKFEMDIPSGAAGAKESAYKLNRYMFIYNFYMDVIYKFGLVDKISTQDKAEIIGNFERFLSKDYPVRLFIRGLISGQDLIISMRVTVDRGKTVVFMVSNYDGAKKSIIPAEGDFGAAYARLYYIFGQKMVNTHSMFDAAREKELQDDTQNVSQAKNNLADMYLFDEIAENDGAVEKLLLDAVSTAKEPVSQVIPKLTLAQYYLMIAKPEKPAGLIAECKKILEQTTDDKNLGEFVAISEEHLAIFNAMK